MGGGGGLIDSHLSILRASSSVGGLQQGGSAVETGSLESVGMHKTIDD